MTKLLDTSCQKIFSDDKVLLRVLSAIQLCRSLDYVSALQRLHEGVESAGGAGATLDAALEAARVTPSEVEQTVTLLERRDAVVRATLEAALPEGIQLDQIKPEIRRQFQLDQPSPGSSPDGIDSAGVPTGPRGPASPRREPVDDIGKVLGDPQEFERRLQRMRAVDDPGHWDGPEGRERFRERDRAFAESGADLLKTTERDRGIDQAVAKATQVQAQLNAAINAAGDERQRIKLLEESIGKLKGPGAASAQEAARKELRSQVDSVMAEPLRLLDSFDGAQTAAEPADASPGSLRTLDQVVALEKPLSAKARAIAARINTQDPRDREEYLQLLDEDASVDDVDQSARVELMLAVRHAPAPPSPRAAEEPKAPEVPEGLHPGSHSLHQKVQARLRQLDRPDSDYSEVLQQILRES